MQIHIFGNVIKKKKRKKKERKTYNPGRKLFLHGKYHRKHRFQIFHAVRAILRFQMFNK